MKVAGVEPRLTPKIPILFVIYGLEYIAKNDPDPVIPYVSEIAPGNYTFILKPEDKKRLIPILDQSQAKYLITTYRFQKPYPAYPEFYSIELNGAKILSVFKLK